VRYHNFDLFIGDGPPGAYPLNVRGPGARSAAGTLDLDPKATDLRADLARMEAGRTDAAFLVDFGRRLYTRLFRDRVGAVFDACYEEVRAQPATGLRLRLSIAPPALAALPWEFLYHPRERAFLASLVQCPLVRFLQDERRARSLLAPTPLRMLVCISELPPGHPPLDAARERADLEQALAGLTGEQVQLDFVTGAVSEGELVDALAREYDCFHFIGHGDFIAGRGRLLLCGDTGDVAALDEDAAVAMFRNATTLKLVVLNACKGATRSSTDLAAGLGPRLIDAGLPAVVAMQYAVQDRAAVLFAREFYRSLFRGANRGLVDHAAAHARARLARHFAASRDLGAPVVFLRADDGLVFDLPARAPIWQRASIDAVDRAGHVVQVLEEEAGTLAEGDSRKTVLLERQQNARHELARVRRAGLSAILGLGIAALALWAAALDRLDLGFERFTGQLGRSLLAPPLDPGLRLVAISKETEEATGKHIGPAWRVRHAALIERLAAAGARTVVFDMAFHEPTERDRDLAQSIRRAAERQPPMTVVLGYSEMLRDTPHVPKALVQGGAQFGFTCFARAAGDEWARSMPLAVRKHGGAVWPALSLAAVAAYWGLTLPRGDSLDTGSGHHLLLTHPGGLQARQVRYSHQAAGSADSQCPAITLGDVTAELLLTNPDLDALRGEDRSLDYAKTLEMDVGSLAPRVKDRLVLVGAAVDRDRARTAVGDRRFGFELHASAINDLLSGRVLARAAPVWQIAVLAVMAVAGAAAGLLGGPARVRRGRLLLVASIVAYVALALLVLVSSLRMLDGVYHLGALLVAYWFATRGAGRAARSRLDAKLSPLPGGAT
jgi:CHASE2 domain-containing sensor protein